MILVYQELYRILSFMQKKSGQFVISLDFELYWGMFDKVNIADYGDNIKGVHTVIPKILSLFQEYNLHATWATVGMLINENFENFHDSLVMPENQPEYNHVALSAYLHANENKEVLINSPEYYFAPKLVKQIIATSGQELGSHTFSHFYAKWCGESCSAAFAADCSAQNKIFNSISVEPEALVFPRNQTTMEALEISYAHGITSYRGNENNFLYKDGTESPLLIRALRLLDAYLNLTGHHTHKIKPVSELPYNVPSSRFLRPYSRKLSILEPLRLRRIKKAMTHAAKQGEVFHLWWHPHNFGTNQTENLNVLKEIAENYKKLQATYGMKSSTMSEAASTAN